MLAALLTTGASSLLLVAAGPDMGPTRGADYAGLDYNITNWNTPASKAADDYKSAFEQRQQVRKTPSWPRSWANSSLV